MHSLQETIELADVCYKLKELVASAYDNLQETIELTVVHYKLKGLVAST